MGDRRATTANYDTAGTKESEVSLSRFDDGVYLVMKSGRETERRDPEARLLNDERRRRSTLLPRNTTDEEVEEGDDGIEMGDRSSLDRQRLELQMRQFEADFVHFRNSFERVKETVTNKGRELLRDQKRIELLNDELNPRTLTPFKELIKTTQKHDYLHERARFLKQVADTAKRKTSLMFRINGSYFRKRGHKIGYFGDL